MTDCDLGPGRLPGLRRRARPAFRRPDQPDRRHRTPHRRRPRLRPGPAHRHVRPRMARGLACSDSTPRRRWSSAAQQYADDRLTFEVADLRAWRPDQPVDVLVSNATLQWVPDHLDLLPSLVDALAPDGWLAIQVPANFGEPSHRLLYALANDPRFADATAGLERPAAPEAASYLATLSGLGLDVDAWETTYLHVLTGPDPVFRWISGPARAQCCRRSPTTSAPTSRREYRRLLREAYPEQGTAPCCPSGVRSRSRHRPAGTGRMLIRDARAADLEVLLRLLDQDAIREVAEDLSDLTPYAAALEEILDRPHSTVLVGELGARPRRHRTGDLAAQTDVRRGTGLPGGVGAGRVEPSQRRSRGGADALDHRRRSPTRLCSYRAHQQRPATGCPPFLRAARASGPPTSA